MLLMDWYSLEGANLKRELADARATWEKQLEAALRAAAAKGGRARAAGYKPAKDLAIALYQKGAGGGCRAAAVREIVPVLEANGLHAKYEFVKETLEAHDRATRERRLKGCGTPQQRR